MSDSGEETFLARLRAQPNDEEARVVYADWLEENGRIAQGEFLRLQLKLTSLTPEDPEFEEASKLLRALANIVTPEWRTLVSRAPIENCDLRFDFACPKKWEGLEATDQGDDVRFCGSCKLNVYYSHSIDEAFEHAKKGRCVVVDLVQIRRPFDLEAKAIEPPRPVFDGPVPEMQLGGMPLPPPRLPLIEPFPEKEKAGGIGAAFRRLWPFGRR